MFILFFLLSFSHAAPLINDEMYELAEFMAIPGQDAELMARPRLQVGDDCNKAEEKAESAPLMPLTILKPESQWRVSFQQSFGVKTNTDEKISFERPSDEIHGRLDSLIQKEFASHDERRQSIKEMCEGKSEMERIQFAQVLGGRLGSIYDYGRVDGATKNNIVSTEDQWRALKEGKAEGVCRDAALTVSQFLIDCGFSPDRVTLDSYASVGAGHQVTSVVGEDGKIYTINWSELFSQTADNYYIQGVQPNIENIGVIHRRYDPVTGKIVEERLNEIGNILKTLAGGKSEYPHHIPEMMRLELNRGNFSLNYFEHLSKGGDETKGASVFLRSNPRYQEWSLSGGVSYAKRTNDTLPQGKLLEQDILFFQAEASLSPKYTLYNNQGDKTIISVQPVVAAGVDIVSTNTKLDDKEGENMDGLRHVTTGVKANAQFDKLNVDASITQKVSYANYLYNTQNEKESGGGFYMSKRDMQAGISYDGETRRYSTNARYIVSSTESQKHLSASVLNKDKEWQTSVVYSVYDRDRGERRSYIGLESNKRWRFEKAGTFDLRLGAQKSLDEVIEEDTVSVQVSWKP